MPIRRTFVHVFTYLEAILIYLAFHLDNAVPPDAHATLNPFHLLSTQEGRTQLSESFHRDELRSLFFLLWTIYFAKRIVEVIFVHKFRSHPNFTYSEAFFEFLFYTIFPFFIGYEVSNRDFGKTERNNCVCIPTITFLIGIATSFYFHIQLRRVERLPNFNVGIPEGVIHSWIAFPHYTSEIITWVSFAFLTCPSRSVMLFALAISVILIIRAQYQSNKLMRLFRGKDGQPAYNSKYKIIPFVY